MKRESERIKKVESMVCIVDVEREEATMRARTRSRYLEINSVGQLQAETMG